MVHDTGIGGGRQFPTTRHSAVVAASSEDDMERGQAWEILVAAYWKPVYKYIRIQWRKSNEESKDLTQQFFLQAMEKEFFHRYDRNKARFRTFLRICLDGFLSNQEKSDARIKRGGGHQILSLDYESAEGELQHIEIPTKDTPEKYFEREWVRSFFEMALNTLRSELTLHGKQKQFEMFESFYLEETSYADLSSRFGLSLTTITNQLAAARRDFRRIVLDQLRQVTATEKEFRKEARFLLGVKLQ